MHVSSFVMKPNSRRRCAFAAWDDRIIARSSHFSFARPHHRSSICRLDAMLVLTEISKRFESPHGPPVDALESLSLNVPAGRFVSILGPSGCGKSTIFNVIAGLEVPTSGSVCVDGVPIDGIPKREACARARPLLERYGVGGFESRYPSQLSGGMRQRAALLRTMLCD